LRASRAVYEFATDRAVLTDALLHSYDPAAAAPIVMRAREMRKLGTDTYEANKASITTSNFATPSLALSASKVTVRQDASNDGNTRTVFRADNVTPRLWGVPVFWFPIVYGTSTDGGLPLRDIQLTNSGGFGTGIATTWGLFETFGQRPPAGVDASYRADYYSERGPALGFDTSYAGGFVDESSLQPYSFNGGLTAYGTIDGGTDKLGRYRGRPSFDDDFRGRIRWQHQQFLSDGWQVQAQAGYISDPTFIEEWFRNEFRNGLEQDTSLYVKRSVGNEVFSVVGNVNVSDIATTTDQLQEVTPNRGNYSPITVERLPQLEYHKLGESLGDDRFTWVSNNSAAGLRFNES
ncbi:LPS-assembly protein LptD, partial [bacterium]